jgi:DNA-binding transcriptional MerR regulator
MNKLFTLFEFSTEVGKHPDTIRRLERQGKIKPLRDHKMKRFFTEDDIKIVKDLYIPK